MPAGTGGCAMVLTPVRRVRTYDANDNTLTDTDANEHTTRYAYDRSNNRGDWGDTHTYTSLPGPLSETLRNPDFDTHVEPILESENESLRTECNLRRRGRKSILAGGAQYLAVGDAIFGANGFQAVTHGWHTKRGHHRGDKRSHGQAACMRCRSGSLL